MTILRTSAIRANPAMNYLGAPRVAFSPNEDGTPTAEETAAAAAAADAAALAAAELEESEADAAAAAAAEAEALAAGKDIKALAADKAKLVKEVMTKKAALKVATDAAAAAAAQLAAYEGVDPAKVKELLKREADAELAAAEAKGDFDRVKEMMAAEHAKDIKKLTDDLAAEKAARITDGELISNLTIGNDFASSTFIREGLTVSPVKARVIYGAHFEIQDGKTVGYDKPAGKTGRTLLVNAEGNALSLDEALKRIVEADPDRDSMLRAKIKEGSSSKSTAAAGTEKPKTDVLYGAGRIAASLNKA